MQGVSVSELHLLLLWCCFAIALVQGVVCFRTAFAVTLVLFCHCSCAGCCLLQSCICCYFGAVLSLLLCRVLSASELHLLLLWCCFVIALVQGVVCFRAAFAVTLVLFCQCSCAGCVCFRAAFAVTLVLFCHCSCAGCVCCLLQTCICCYFSAVLSLLLCRVCLFQSCICSYFGAVLPLLLCRVCLFQSCICCYFGAVLPLLLCRVCLFQSCICCYFGAVLPLLLCRVLSASELHLLLLWCFFEDYFGADFTLL